MYVNNSISRRYLLKSASTLAASNIICGLCGCSANPEFYASIANVSSILLIPFAVSTASNVFTNHVVEPALVKENSVTQEAEKHPEVNIDMCIKAAKVCGGNVVVDCLKNNVPIWSQYNKDINGINEFNITLTNNSPSEDGKGGQLKFALKDIDTGAIDYTWWGYPFLIGRNETKQLIYRTKGVDFMRHGRKRIVAVNWPPEITVNSAELLVAPMAMSIKI